MSDIQVTVYVTITDPEALRLAAETRALEDGLTEEAWHEIRKSTSDDLIMLLDPGTLPGCKIFETQVE